MRFRNRLSNYFRYLRPVWDDEQMVGLNVFEMYDEMNNFLINLMKTKLEELNEK